MRDIRAVSMCSAQPAGLAMVLTCRLHRGACAIKATKQCRRRGRLFRGECGHAAVWLITSSQVLASSRVLGINHLMARGYAETQPSCTAEACEAEFERQCVDASEAACAKEAARLCAAVCEPVATCTPS